MIRPIHWKFILLLPVFVLTACATPDLTPSEISKEALKQEQTQQYKQALVYQAEQQKRLAEVARPLLKHSVEECRSRTRYSAGIFLHKTSEYPKEQRIAATELYGESEYVQVLNVLKTGSSQGVLLEGDQILAINQAQSKEHSTAKIIELLNSAMSDGDDVELQIQRQEKPLTLKLTPELICDYTVILSPSDAVNGYADGSSIIITAGLMRFLQKDEQLAFIIAHELAHNTLDHIPKKLTNGSWGTVIDILLTSTGFPSPLVATGIGANLHSQSFETEADLEALRLMQKAGYPIESMDQLWREMAMLHPATITHGKAISHPTTVERSIRIREKVRELSH